MKKHKFDLVIGGILLGCAVAGTPYDWTNLIPLAIGVLWVFSAWISLPTKL